jgi:hypothetical protein
MKGHCMHTRDWSAVPGDHADRPPFRLAFTNTTRLDIPGTMHQRGTCRLLITIYGEEQDAPPALRDQGLLRWTPMRLADMITVNPRTYDVVVTFAQRQTGTVVITAP